MLVLFRSSQNVMVRIIVDLSLNNQNSRLAWVGADSRKRINNLKS